MSLQRGFKQWAEKQAARLRWELQLAREARLPAWQLAQHLGVDVISPEHIPGMLPTHVERLVYTDRSSWSAITIMPGEDVLIIYNPSHAPVRQESDLLHELAHLVCEHAPAQIIRFAGLPLRTYDQVQEEEAGWLGACLHLPRAALLWALQRGMSDAEIESLYVASDDVLRYRRSVTGVDMQLGRRRVMKRKAYP